MSYIDHDRNGLIERGLLWKGGHIPYNPKLKERAQYMRKNMTEAETKLRKEYLKKFPYTVLRQKPIDNYIVDFYIPALHLVIEVDGEIHNTQDHKEYDELRENLLKKYDLIIVRFTNDEIFNQFDEVCKTIKSFDC